MPQPYVADSSQPAPSRRAVLRWFGGGMALALLSACGPIAPQATPAPPGTGSTQAPAPGGAAVSATPASGAAPSATPSGAAAAAQPRSGGVLKIADTDPQRLDGHLILA